MNRPGVRKSEVRMSYSQSARRRNAKMSLSQGARKKELKKNKSGKSILN